MKNLLLAVACALFANVCAAQKEFFIKDASANYLVKLQVEACADNICSGKGTVSLFKNDTTKLFQKLTSQDLYFFLDERNGKPTSNIVELYGEQSPLIFDDFNFDGLQDLAIRNGNNGGYGGPSYDVFVFNASRKQFVLSRQLTKLATENLGMFYVDKKRQTLTTFSKSGCCWHKTTGYKVVPKKGLAEVYTLEEDAIAIPDYVVVTERKLIKSKWSETTKKYKIKDYYKEN